MVYGLLKCLSTIPATITIWLVLVCLPVSAVPVGPQLPGDPAKPKAVNEVQATYPRLDIPELDIAVVILNPNYDENDDKLRDKGIWPEVRKTESIRSAYRIKEALQSTNQFENVLVAPSTDVSADLYLRGRIDASTTEILDIRWTLIDARGTTWIDWNTTKHRVALGWHQRVYQPGVDPFRPLYAAIARDVVEKLTKPYAKQHIETKKRNQQLTRRGKSPRLSNLEEITLTRDLVLARYFDPEQYSDALFVDKKRWKVRYLPDMESNDWLRIQNFATRDADFAELYDNQYERFFEEVNPSYEQWLNDVFPYAREARLEARRAKTEQIVGGLVLVATAVAAADATSASARDTALAVGGTVGGGLILSSMRNRAQFKRNLSLFDEMSKKYHDDFRPTNISIVDETRHVQGTAANQFSQLRQLLKEMYAKDEVDAYNIQVIATKN